MARFTTQSDGITLVLHCQDRFAVQAESLLDAIKSFAGNGVGLKDGVRIQMGWSLLCLKQRDTELVVCEPNFDTNPFSEREDVTTTLKVLLEQSILLQRLGVAPLDFRFDDKIVMANGCLAEQNVVLTRSEPTPGDSGWYICGMRNDVTELEAIYTCQLLHTRPAFLQVLSLPAEYMVVFDGDQIEFVLNPAAEHLWP